MVQNAICSFLGFVSREQYNQLSIEVDKLKQQTSFMDSHNLVPEIFSLFKSCGENTQVFAPMKFSNLHNVSLGKDVFISSHLWLHTIEKYGTKTFTPYLEIGDGTYIGHYCEIAACNRVTIGKNCLFADHIFVADADHDYHNFSISIKSEIIGNKTISIGNECWIGDGVKILPGTQIGNRCVVGANSVVKGIFPDNVMIAGVPAKIVRVYNPQEKIWVKNF